MLQSAAAAACLAACSRSAVATTAPDLRATVTEVTQPDASRQPVVRVFVDRSAAPGAGAAMPITLTGSSEVYVAQGGRERRTDYRALRAGQSIAVWFVENTAETNPGARQARRVVIEEGAS